MKKKQSTKESDVIGVPQGGDKRW